MDLIEMVKSLPETEQRGALKALDFCTRPMRVREVEHALMRMGLPCFKAKKVASSLRKIAIVAVAMEDAE